jgi:hypothetical protein
MRSTRCGGRQPSAPRPCRHSRPASTPTPPSSASSTRCCSRRCPGRTLLIHRRDRCGVLGAVLAFVFGDEGSRDVRDLCGGLRPAVAAAWPHIALTECVPRSSRGLVGSRTSGRRYEERSGPAVNGPTTSSRGSAPTIVSTFPSSVIVCPGAAGSLAKSERSKPLVTIETPSLPGSSSPARNDRPTTGVTPGRDKQLAPTPVKTMDGVDRGMALREE